VIFVGIAIGAVAILLLQRFGKYMNDNWSWGPGEFL
jgi:hypothetical protein